MGGNHLQVFQQLNRQHLLLHRNLRMQSIDLQEKYLDYLETDG